MTTIDYTLIPLTVIGGFLGAGKTTYLNRLIQGGLPKDALIIVNDFGDINIDAALIDYRDDSIIQLSNGCVCCTLGGTLAEQLAQALRIRAAPGAILIEASGVANPARIADIARISRRLRLAEVVCIIDGSRARQHAENPLIGEAWQTQLAAADKLLVNRLDPADRQESEKWLKQFNSWAHIEYEIERTPDSVRTQPSPRLLKPKAKRLSSHGHWHTFSLSGRTRIDKERLETLIAAYQEVLFRAKGFLLAEHSSSTELLQFSGGRLHWQSALRAPQETRLVFIGIAGERFSHFEQAVQGLLRKSASSEIVLTSEPAAK
jgi:G3E family GTPase